MSQLTSGADRSSREKTWGDNGMLEMHSSHTYMLVMNWGAFDLNLLIVFDAVMQERSVTRAGSRIGLSQPAMSHALNRLRYMLKDELFIRTPEGMVPTPRAESLAQPLRDALSEMQLALEPARSTRPRPTGASRLRSTTTPRSCSLRRWSLRCRRRRRLSTSICGQAGPWISSTAWVAAILT
jgi:DNA-binding transcriptional LysR family regulator